MSARKLARRACDACKIRKIKCSEIPPCESCINAGVECTFNKRVQMRGPRKLRDATLQEIRRAQDTLNRQSVPGHNSTPSTRYSGTDDPDPPPPPSSEISNLVEHLCLYRVKLYRIWPIIKVERIIASLQSPTADIEVFALAYAVAAATVARTLHEEGPSTPEQDVTTLEAKCLAARARVPSDRKPNVTTVRIAFFLHCLHETLSSGSMKSMLYLREAITVAQMISLHKEAYYAEVPVVEQQIRRRILWMLYVTERVMCVLYHHPITLRTKIAPPSTYDSDNTEVLLTFLRLVELFVAVDNVGLFHVLDDADSESWSSGILTCTMPSVNSATLSPQLNRLVHMDRDLDVNLTHCWLLLVLHSLRVERFQHMPSFDDLSEVHQSMHLLINCFEASTEATKQLYEPALSNKCAQIAAGLALLGTSTEATFKTGGNHTFSEIQDQFVKMCLQMGSKKDFKLRLAKELRTRPYLTSWIQGLQERGLLPQLQLSEDTAHLSPVNGESPSISGLFGSPTIDPMQGQLRWPDEAHINMFGMDDDHASHELDRQGGWHSEQIYNALGMDEFDTYKSGSVTTGLSLPDGSGSPEFADVSQTFAVMTNPLSTPDLNESPHEKKRNEL